MQALDVEGLVGISATSTTRSPFDLSRRTYRPPGVVGRVNSGPDAPPHHRWRRDKLGPPSYIGASAGVVRRVGISLLAPGVLVLVAFQLWGTSLFA